MFDRDLVISYKGKEHRLSITWAVAREVDNFSPEYDLRQLITRGGASLKLTQCAEFLTFILQKMGVDCTEEQLFTEFFSDGDQDMVYGQAIMLVDNIVGHFVPETSIDDDDSKKKKKSKRK